MTANAARADDDEATRLTELYEDAFTLGHAACEASHPQAGASMWLAVAWTMACVLAGSLVAAAAMTMGAGCLP